MARSGLVAIALALTGLPDALIAASAPSMRGWMLSAPGVAMKIATSPLGTELDDPLAHLEPGHVQVLADVGLRAFAPARAPSAL